MWSMLFVYTQSTDAYQKVTDAAFYYEVLSKQQNNLPASREVVIPADVKVSVIIMNHGRPYMLKKSNLMPTLLAHNSIDQVMICHSNPKTKFDYDHPKVTHIDAIEANKKMGLSLRFHFCQEAKNPWIMIVDDDQEISSSAIDQLLSEFAANPKRIVGKFGRGYSFWSAPWRYGYNTKNIMGDVEVVLTKFMALERQLCHRFFEYSHLVSDLLPESKPLWNAEDIFMSLTANHVYNVPFSGPFNNYAMPLDVWEAPDAVYKDGDIEVDNVSGNLDRITWYNDGLQPYLTAYSKATTHTRYRGRLWYNAKRRLAALNVTATR
eukprot:CAMPEP_0119018944 /NCGR_PEP_ID=MMETSP1176-20130426/20659_1 /TAXON_ID=265551 /ORGANISM="Synedropsis recta cf, Strain CCMP1620" /LENGTH=320 /DNA_ID=CAMNT_0006973057 /DNA_START=269 /DNA_END=1231 /DNA_ORIENTATION=-